MCSLANGTLAQILFSVLLICEIGGNNYKILFYVLPSLEKDFILSITFIKAFRVIINFVSGIVTISHRSSGDNRNIAGTRLWTMGKMGKLQTIIDIRSVHSTFGI